MFRQLAAALPGGPNQVLTGYRPSQLAEYLETFWNTGRLTARQLALGPSLGSFHQLMARSDILDPLPPTAADPPSAPQPVGWHHLAYAYMIENTRIADIFRRVIFEWVTGESLPIPTQPTQRWLQVTEQLFFGNPWAYSVHSVTSSVRPDKGAVRRNAYYRLLGMDLNHGTDDGQTYPFIKPYAANREFPLLFENLLVEVWRGHASRNNSIAENPTDDNAIVTLVRRLREMLQTRRHAGTLSREEFDAVAFASWLHLTVETNTTIVTDLSCHAEASADRLMRIGDRVGLPAHSRSDAYFQLAVPMSNILLAIESSSITQALDLYDGFYTPDMLAIITHWSVATGRNIKDPTARQPISHVLRQLPPGGMPAGLLSAPSARTGVLIR